MAIDVFGLGKCSLDYLGTVDSYPSPDTKCQFSGMVIQGGGPVATALTALSRWGSSCAFAGIIGDDQFGTATRESLDCEGIDTSGLVVRNNSSSQFAFIVVEAGSGRRTIFWQPPTGASLNTGEIDRGKLKSAHVFHTDGYFVEAGLEACCMAKNAGIPVVVDAGTLREGMLDFARLSTCFIASEGFAAALTGGDNPVEACHLLADLGPKVTAVTLGSRGSVALVEGEVIRQRPYPVDTVDTTGCGDVFHAGFIYGLLHAWPIRQSLDFASWAAGQVSRTVGGRTGIPHKAIWPERFSRI
nr:sugar kinase [Deltaproteobacteria bacterium]